MSISKGFGGLLLVLSSFSAFAEAPGGSYDQTHGAAEEETVNSGNAMLLERVLEDADPKSRYLGLISFIRAHGEWVLIGDSDASARVHITSYLLQRDKANDAATLVRFGDVKPWLSYRFQDGVVNDFVFALDGEHLEYLDALFKFAPEGINTPILLTAAGQEVLPLALLASGNYNQSPFFESIVRNMLANGANPDLEMPNGLTPTLIASSTNNYTFNRIVRAHLSEQSGRGDGLLKNTALDSSAMVEQQAVVDALIERHGDLVTSANLNRIHDMWTQMILKGYNQAADMLYEILIRKEGFNIDYRHNDGLTGLMAASLSQIYGGNVEYADRLIERGSDPAVLFEIDLGGGNSAMINLIQLALQRDNYKNVALYIQKGVNFIFAPGEDELLIFTEAMEQSAFKSAYIIREALATSVEQTGVSFSELE